MAYTSDDQKEVFLKLLYVGAPQAGKTTNLQSLYKQSAQGLKSRRFDLFEVSEQSLLFDFLPLAYPLLHKQQIRLHLYSLPSHDLFPSVLKMLLTGIDGCVLVLDSRQTRYLENQRHLERLNALFYENGFADLSDLPFVCQCNHRDAELTFPMESLREALKDFPVDHWVEAVAVQDIGVLETLEQLVTRVISRAIPQHQLSNLSPQP